ncbi:hypothetical protein BD410DRAFT_18164 [Rickenella mellea]|uniref:Nuclear GTPase SLIP-GC n=1 Tax=Rickenella mellea TaxID=50990 RepID=A0A4R5XEB6_9AGAM|nr:hypothetical protein BD410DRAFT_18164 [Rickenella mellea]
MKPPLRSVTSVPYSSPTTQADLFPIGPTLIHLFVMNSKENKTNSTGTALIKPELIDQHVIPLADSKSWQTQRDAQRDASGPSKPVKPEPGDAARVFLERGLPVPSYVQSGNVPSFVAPANVGVQSKAVKKPSDDVFDGTVAEKTAKDFNTYNSSNEIVYTPENAIKEAAGMTKTVKAHLMKLELGSKLRKDVWLREVASLESQGAPTTMIAVCGATGAGKSSTLNAILGDNVVPTSGMRACTAVVTEIAYHGAKTIAADVSFLTESEWKEELEVLLDDLTDEDGHLKRSTDLRSEAGVAWHKVHAVYPKISQEQLVRLTADQIIERDPRVAKLLGTTKKIIAKNSKEFAREISKYIDSKDQKRGDKKKKDKSAKDSKSNKKEKANPDDPALWPLIRQVNVKCNSEALKTGAILVDLPGVADANAARSCIAKDYMKKCNCIWILAPITRAVDDKTARDLLGDAFKAQLMMDGGFADVESTITFVATKCDDISCSEVIRALQLEDEPELEDIEDRLSECKTGTKEAKARKAAAEKSAKAIDETLKGVRAEIADFEANLKAIQEGIKFVPLFTAKDKAKSKKAGASKRKNQSGSKQGSPKRRKGDDDDQDSFVVYDDDDDDIDMMSDSSGVSGLDDNSSNGGSDDEDDDDDDDKSDKSDQSEESEHESDEDESKEDEPTEDELKARIAEKRDELKAEREKLSLARKQRKEAADELAGLKEKEVKAQREKNAFCSLKRSEFSRDVLKEDFRTGLKDLDDAAAEERDPNSFDPNVNLRDYANIALPTFTTSSRDYIRLTKQAKGDGDPTCFSNVDDTGIPALQNWCHTLTIRSRERSAKSFRSQLRTFVASVKNYLNGIGDVTEADRAALRDKWESDPSEDSDEDEDGAYNYGMADIDDVLYDLPGLSGLINHEPLYAMGKKAKKLDASGEPQGVTPYLIKAFEHVVDENVKLMRTAFKDGLEEKCQVGAENAERTAVVTSDTFAASMHWGTYRATLRRNGSWRRDLNEELIAPMTRNIASSWAMVFEADLFANFEASAIQAIVDLLHRIEESCPMALVDRAKGQGELCLEEAKEAFKKTLDIVRETMNTEQKEVSRCLAPHVQGQLTDGYERAMEEHGRGSVARQKAVFHDFIDRNKGEIFTGGADTLLERLDKAALAVGDALQDALESLAQKVEVSLSVLWEGPKDEVRQVAVRQDAIQVVDEVLSQVTLWDHADKMRV